MKQAISFCLVWLMCCIKWVSACNDLPVYGRILSCEQNTTSASVSVEWRFYVRETCKFVGFPTLKAPTAYAITCTNCVEGQVVSREDSITIQLQFSFPTTNQPFYPHEFSFFQAFESLENATLGVFTEESQGHYYFTPYQTLEIWNDNDYYSLSRMWLHPANKLDTTHLFMNKSDIPLSNLGINDTIVEGQEWTEDWRWKKVNGLPYLIPMKALSPDSMAYYSQNVGDGPDSLNSRATFAGIVTGRLLTQVVNDLGIVVTIPLAGIRVKLLEEDLMGFEVFDEDYTDEQGYYTFTYAKAQAFEGGQIELRVQIKSKTKEDWNYKIKAKKSNFWQDIYEKKIAQIGAGSTFTWSIGDIIENDDPYRLVHWARRAKQYVENNGFSPLLTSELTILPFRDNSNFIADGYYLAAPLLDPTIRMRDDDGDRESVIRHEFGHFLMWELQNRTFITLYSENNCSSHPFNAENTSRQAWTEGWADAIAMILDAAYWQEDGEYGQPFTRLKVPMYENNVRFYANPSLPFNNGIRSEYNLAASIYDLWDGANKGLPSQIPPKAANAVVDVSEVAVTISHGFNDQFTSVSDPDVSEAALHWESIDDVEYSFADIIEPLLAHRGLGNNIQHISAYFQYFLSDVVGNDCQQLANVSRVFRENRVLQDIDFYEVHAGNNCLNTDGIGMVIDFEDAAQICPFGNALITNYQDQYVTNYFPRSQNEIFNFPFLPIQSGSNIPGYYPYITDDLWLGNMGNNGFPTTSCIFSINGDGNFPSILQNGTLETCGGVDIELNNATMMLGNASSLTANLIFNAGSTLKISSNGVLIIHDNSKIIIESGAKLTIEQGAQIQLLGNNAILEIRDTLDLKDKAIFTFTGDGFVRFANGNTIIAASNSEIKFTGSSPSDKVVEIADNSFISNYNLVKTTLQHGRCELGQNAFWDTGNGQVLFTDAVFTALDNTKPYQTIYTNGQDPTIQDCQFSYGQTGLTARNFMSLGASITLTNVEIHHCNIALRDYDKGAHLENVHFHHNNIGWKAAYQAFNSQLLNSEIDNNTYEGVTFTGNTNLAVESPNIHHNLYGLDFIGAGNLVPVCGGVIFNGSTGIGGYQNAKIQLSGNPLSSPKVNLSYNTTSSVFLWGARVYLNEGRNNLSPEQGGMALAVITPQTNSLNAKHNHWNENSIPYGTSPVFGTDYNLYSIGSANPVNVIDNQPIEYESCNGIIQRQMYIPECVECEVIKTPHFDYVRIDSALRQVAEDLYEYSRFQHVAANYGLLTEILEFAYTKSDITQDEVLNIALDIAKYTFAEGIATATISYNSTGEIGQPAAKIFQLIDSRITNTLDTPSVFYRKIDKAILYNLLQRPALSLTVLNAITTENAEQAEYQAYWTCFVELRRDMQLQTIESAEITRRLAVCPAISRPSQGANKMESPQIAASLSLFPNPSQAEVQISLFSPQENEASLAVYDIQGRKVQEIALFACQKGTNMLSLSATSLTNGMYSVVIQLGNEVLSHKWLVQK